MISDSTVFVVDDDEGMRRSLRRMLEFVGLHVETFGDARAFLDHYDPHMPGCLILDIRMPEMDGLELQDRLVRDGRDIPVIIMSAHGDVETTVRAIKSGAVDFLKKPYKARVLLERIHESLTLDARRRRVQARRAKAAARLDSLTAREREVMGFLVEGKSTKRIAFELGLSRKTVDTHRGHIMTKLQADSVVDLVRMWPEHVGT